MNLLRPSALFFLFALFLIQAPAGLAQQIMLTLDVEEDADNFNVIEHGDSVLLSYRAKGSIKSQWIHNGKSTISQSGVYPIATAPVGTKLFHYFLTGDRKSALLKALVEESGSGKLHPDFLAFDTEQLIATDRDSVFRTISYNPKSNELIIRELDGMKTIKEARHVLPFKIADFQPEFYADASPASSFSGISKVRFYKREKLYIVFDQRYRSAKRPGKTEIAVIPWEDGALEHITIPTTVKADFQSFLIDDKLFRAFITEEKFLIRIHDIHTSKVLSQIPITRDRTTKVFSRSGRNSLVDSTSSLNRAMRTAQYSTPYLTIVKDSGNYVVLFGNYYENSPAVPLVVAPLGGLIASAIVAGAFAAMERPGTLNYLYLKVDSEKLNMEFNNRNTRARLDRFEIVLQESEKIRNKVYTSFKGGILASYHLPKKNQVMLTWFN
jgi:hypothetical protein